MTTPEPTWTVEQACAELAVWNAANERSRASYDAEPFALTRIGTRPCSRCRHGQHRACSGEAQHNGRVMCRCWLDDHTHRRTR